MDSEWVLMESALVSLLSVVTQGSELLSAPWVVAQGSVLSSMTPVVAPSVGVGPEEVAQSVVTGAPYTGWPQSAVVVTEIGPDVVGVTGEVVTDTGGVVVGRGVLDGRGTTGASVRGATGGATMDVLFSNVGTSSGNPSSVPPSVRPPQAAATVVPKANTAARLRPA